MLKNYKMFVESLNARGIMKSKTDIASTSEYDAKAWKKFKFALITLSNKHPFFSDVLYEMKVLMSYRVETMATDGTAVIFNPHFLLEELDEGSATECQESVFVIAHEVMHVILNHMVRAHDLDITSKEDHWNWNVAGDYAINIMLDDGNGNAVGKKPSMVLWDKKMEYLSTEVIYNKIVNNDPDKPEVPPMPPSPGDGDDEEQEPQIGDYIRTKKGKKFGKITKIYNDGTFDYVEVTKEEATEAMNKQK